MKTGNNDMQSMCLDGGRAQDRTVDPFGVNVVVAYLSGSRSIRNYVQKQWYVAVHADASAAACLANSRRSDYCVITAIGDDGFANNETMGRSGGGDLSGCILLG